jgi:hypothetical protein
MWRFSITYRTILLSVVSAACVRDDRHQHIPLGRDELRARGQVDVPLLANRILRAIAVGIVVRVVEERVDGLIAFKVDDAHELAFRKYVNERVPREHFSAEDRVLGIARAHLYNGFWHA